MKSMVKKEMALPFYLHPSDGQGNLIPSVQLKGENYEDWAKHVRNALQTKRELGFIDGTLKKPETGEEVEQWEVVNSMLVASLEGIRHSVSGSPFTSLQHSYYKRLR